MANLEKCLKELQYAVKIKNRKERKAILKYLCSKNCVQEAIRNVLLCIDKLKLTNTQKRQIYKFRKSIKGFRKGLKSKGKRQENSVLIGEGLPFLIPAALSILPTIIDLFKK